MFSNSVPKFSGKYHSKPLFTASDFLEKALGSTEKLPRSAIMVFSRTLFSLLSDDLKLENSDFPYGGTFKEGISHEKDLVVIHLAPGAPLASTTVEEIASLGVERILLLGTAGSINHKAKFNDVIICSKALRDEGTSYHYTKKGHYSYPSKDLTNQLKGKLQKDGLSYIYGPSWTTDAPYTETVAEIERYSSLGILTVEMEASAVFTVAGIRGVEAAAVFSVSDELHGESWTGIKSPENGFKKLVKAGSLFVETLRD